MERKAVFRMVSPFVRYEVGNGPLVSIEAGYRAVFVSLFELLLPVPCLLARWLMMLSHSHYSNLASCISFTTIQFVSCAVG